MISIRSRREFEMRDRKSAATHFTAANHTASNAKSAFNTAVTKLRFHHVFSAGPECHARLGPQELHQRLGWSVAFREPRPADGVATETFSRPQHTLNRGLTSFGNSLHFQVRVRPAGLYRSLLFYGTGADLNSASSIYRTSGA